MTEQSLSNTHTVSIRYITTLLHLGTLHSTSAHLKDSIITPKRHKNYEKCGTKETAKRTLDYSMRVKTRRQMSPCTTSVKNVHSRQLVFFLSHLYT